MPPSSLVSPRPCSSRTSGTEQDTGTHPETLYLAKYPRRRTKVLQVLHYLYAVQTTAPQTIRIPPTASYSRTPMEFNFYGLHWETPFLLWFWHYPSYSGSTVETSNIHPYPRHHHFSGTSMPVRHPCLFKAWSPISCYVRLRFWICLSLLPLPRYHAGYEASLYQWIPSGDKRSSRIDQPDVGTVSPLILQLPTGQLVGIITSGWICIQQRS